MAKLLRLVLVALIALAVPLQGALAVGTAQCLALEHQDGAGHNHSHDGHDSDSSSHDRDSPASHSHCGPCVACCASASIASAPALPVVAPPRFAVDVLPNFPLVGDLPGGLFRPPLAL
jgi:DUF2946 family protein